MAASQEYGTIIGPDAKFTGDLTLEGAATVQGSFEGSIQGNGKVQIADGCTCKATISAKEVTVEGHIEGNVQAADRVDLQPKGRITGDIEAARMSMADGAAFVGHCRIGVNGKSTSRTELKPASGATTTTTTTTATAAKK